MGPSFRPPLALRLLLSSCSGAFSLLLSCVWFLVCRLSHTRAPMVKCSNPCGPKCSICCMVFSIWGALTLAVVGVLLHVDYHKIYAYDTFPGVKANDTECDKS